MEHDRSGLRAGGILDLLSARVGPSGQVIGVDLDSGHAASARAVARDRSLANVQVMNADARRTGLPGGTFDLVHTRLVLVNISRPADVVAEMARLAKPGGWVAALEVDAALAVCHPRHPALDRLTELLVTVLRQDGADPELGRRLPHLFRDAGLTDVGVEARVDVYPAGHPQRTDGEHGRHRGSQAGHPGGRCRRQGCRPVRQTAVPREPQRPGPG